MHGIAIGTPISSLATRPTGDAAEHEWPPIARTCAGDDDRGGADAAPTRNAEPGAAGRKRRPVIDADAAPEI